MAKKKTATVYKDRKYNYPKGFTKYGKTKTGFMPAAQGAKLFVEANLEKIKKGQIPYDSLTTREKRVYRGKTSNTLANTFTFKDKRYYDPTGLLRKALDNDPKLKGKRDLTNLLPEEGFKAYFNNRINPTKGKTKLSEKERSKWLEFSSSLYDFNKGEKKQFYRDESGSLMDIVTKLQKARKQGREIRVIQSYYFDKNTKQLEPMPPPSGYDGEVKISVKEFTGSEAIETMRQFEARKLQEYVDKAKPGQNIQLQIIYISTDWNPYTNTVTFNLNNVQVNNLNDTP